MFPLRDDVHAERLPVVNIALIAINILAFLWLGMRPQNLQHETTIQHGFIPVRLTQWKTPGPKIIETPEIADQRTGEILAPAQAVPVSAAPASILLTMLTCMFLHGGWAHVLGNMWFLWIFGDNVEDRLGHWLYLAFYLVGGIAATLCHWYSTPNSSIPVIGASGAVAAVLGAYAVTWPWARIHTFVMLVFIITFIELPALVVLGVWFLAQLMSASNPGGLEIDGGVAWWAHVGGFAVGAILMLVLRGPDPRRPTVYAPRAESWE